MTNGTMPLGHHTGPREHWFAKMQIMGGPAMNWQMTLDPPMVKAFLRQRMGSLTWGAPEMVNGETIIGFDYEWSRGYLDEHGNGELRITPKSGLYLARFTSGLSYDLLEDVVRAHPENTQIVVAFEHIRALPYTPGLPRYEGIFRLTDLCDIPLSKALFPGEWRE
jgi:hypothetical protein